MWVVTSRDCTTSLLVPISLPEPPSTPSADLLRISPGRVGHQWDKASLRFPRNHPRSPSFAITVEQLPCTHETISAYARVCDGSTKAIASGTPRLWLGTWARPQDLAGRESSALRASTPLPRPCRHRGAKSASQHARTQKLTASAHQRCCDLTSLCRSTSYLNMGKQSARNQKAYFVSGVETHKRCHAEPCRAMPSHAVLEQR